MIKLLKNLPVHKKHSVIVMLIAIIAVIVYVLEYVVAGSFGKYIADLLVYNQQSITEGDVWRIFTGHFLHTNAYHLLLNLAALILLWALHGHFYTIKNYSALFLTTALLCSVCMYFFSPDIKQYVGLSGVLHGIFVFGALLDIRNGDKTGYLLFLGVWLKIADEQYFGASEDVSSLINATVAIDAHMWGALAGLVFTSIYLYHSNNTNQYKKVIT